MLFSVALIHTSADVVPLLTQVANEVIPGVELIHVVDEGLLRMTKEAGGLTEPIARRVCSHAINAQEAGAEAVMLTAPSIGRAIDVVKASVGIPALRLDWAMAEAAVQFGASIGVVADQELNLGPTLALLRERAHARAKDVVFETRLCEDASLALKGGDTEAYDLIIVNEVRHLADNDVVVLADVMMHRAAQAASERVRVPVLTSPKHGFEELARRLNYFRR